MSPPPVSLPALVDNVEDGLMPLPEWTGDEIPGYPENTTGAGKRTDEGRQELELFPLPSSVAPGQVQDELESRMRRDDAEAVADSAQDQDKEVSACEMAIKGGPAGAPRETDDLESRSGGQEDAPDSAPKLGETTVTDETRMEEDNTGNVQEVEEEPAPKSPAFLKLLQSLQTTQADIEEPPREIEAAVSSPLSDLPELPTEFPSPRSLSPRLEPVVDQVPAMSTALLPKTSFLPDVQPVAELSSAAAARRSVSISTIGTKRAANGQGKNKGKPSEDIQGSTSATEGDDLESISGSSEVLIDIKDERETSKRKYKKIKGLDGKAVRTSARSRKRLDAVLGISHENDKAPEKIAPRAKALTEAQIRAELKGKTRERQMGPCLRARYAQWGKCTQCVSKLGGDSCRFRDYRVFPIDPNNQHIIGPGWFESAELKEEITPLPTEFNTLLEEEHILKTERTVAPILLPLINRELRHVVHSKAIKRGVDSAKNRSVCDFCSSTIFAGYWFCKKCGRDFCLQCERYFSDGMESMSASPWPLPDAARPRLLKCNATVEMDGADGAMEGERAGSGKAKHKPAFHFRSDLQPVSRFSEKELRVHWLALASFVLEDRNPTSTPVHLRLLGVSEDDEIIQAIEGWQSTLAYSPSERDATDVISPEDIERLYTKSTNPTAIPIPDPAGLEENSHSFIRISVSSLDNAQFDVLWGRGEPIVVDDVDKRLKQSWTPDAFIEQYGHDLCHVVDCQSNTSKKTTVGHFFETFKDQGNRGKAILKLKDWPAIDDFRDTHRELYDDFCDALPVPNYTRREGVLNLYAHFPPGPTKPDIGPKMYNAFEAVESTGGFGSTRLHMDVADAVNVMLYASSRTDGQPGCAVWDLFRAEDAGKIRSFLQTKFDKTHVFTDPIHSQLFYLDASLRKELWERYGVISFRVYQYPGQAVFIPAGCAHQVCNLADCIKIALDFVSPHNVSRCQQLTNDFRTENFVKAWKEDVLQLYNVLWYAWLSSREGRSRRHLEDEEKRKVEEARQKHLLSLQKGEHPTNPIRGMLSSRSWAVSSVRDEEPMREGSTSGQPSPAPTDLVGFTSPISFERGRDVVDAPKDAEPTHLAEVESSGEALMATDREHSKGDGQPKEEDGESPTKPLGPVDIKHALTLRLLSASLSAPNATPPPVPRGPSAATRWTIPKRSLTGSTRPAVRVKSEPRPPPSKVERPRRMKDLIRQGHIPMDLVVGVAKAAMGEGAEKDVRMFEASGE